MRAGATTLHEWNTKDGDIDFANVSVLVVDDHRPARAFMQAALAVFNIRNVVQTACANEAFQAMAAHQFHLALIDLNLPDMDGVEITRRIRRGIDGKQPELPIIMVSGETTIERVVAARDAGIHEFVAKPVSPDILFRRIHATLTCPRPFVRTAEYIGPDRRAPGRKEPIRRTFLAPQVLVAEPA